MENSCKNVLKDTALHFLQYSCEGLRHDADKTAEEAAKKCFLGRSIAANQIPYNAQMDIDRLCFRNALERALDSGSAQDAFDVYFCYLEMFVGDYADSRSMIEMLSEFEMNGSSLLMRHRDHYVHSIYVFALGLAIYETNAVFRAKYMEVYGFDPVEGQKKSAHHFLEYWGMASLFHDIGYPFELPFEQVESYFEIRGEKRKNNPYMAYLGLEHFISIDPDIQAELEQLYSEEKEKKFDSTDELFAFAIQKRLGKVYRLSKDDMQVVLATKPVNPNRFGYYMDHAYFSASVLFQELYHGGGDGKKITEAGVDALTAIILHNSLYKFSVAFYKSEINIPLEMKCHPLAYMLMLCDELQCWDRISYGRNSRTELHPMGCELKLDDGKIEVKYLFDQTEKDKIDRFETQYKNWDKQDKNAEPKLKAYSSMVNENEFLQDIKRIVNTADLGLSVDVDLRKADYQRKNIYLSSSNFIHLYNFAVALNARYSHQGEEELSAIDKKMEEEFQELSLEYKLSNIGQAKAFAGYLDKIRCFYTDKPVDFEIVDQFTEEDMNIIGPLEHERWLREHQKMGWKYGEDYSSRAEREQKRIHKLMLDGELTSERVREHYDNLAESEKDKDTEPMNSMLKLLKQYDGVRIYRLKDVKGETV